MAFLRFPIMFTEDDFEEKENLRLKPERTQGEIAINTYQICAYNEMDNGNTMARMASGECYEIPMPLADFEKLLSEVENIFNLSNIAEN